MEKIIFRDENSGQQFTLDLSKLPPEITSLYEVSELPGLTPAQKTALYAAIYNLTAASRYQAANLTIIAKPNSRETIIAVSAGILPMRGFKFMQHGIEADFYANLGDGYTNLQYEGPAKWEIVDDEGVATELDVSDYSELQSISFTVEASSPVANLLDANGRQLTHVISISLDCGEGSVKAGETDVLLRTTERYWEIYKNAAKDK